MNKLIKQYNIYEAYLNRKAMLSLNITEKVINNILENPVKDKQWVLNYLDELNEQSVRY